jgi:hypothetical protein
MLQQGCKNRVNDVLRQTGGQSIIALQMAQGATQCVRCQVGQCLGRSQRRTTVAIASISIAFHQNVIVFDWIQSRNRSIGKLSIKKEDETKTKKSVSRLIDGFLLSILSFHSFILMLVCHIHMNNFHMSKNSPPKRRNIAAKSAEKKPYYRRFLWSDQRMKMKLLLIPAVCVK